MNKLEIPTQTSAILSNASIGLWTIESERGTKARMYADSTMLRTLGIEGYLEPDVLYSEWQKGIVAVELPEVNERLWLALNGGKCDFQYTRMHPEKGLRRYRITGMFNSESGMLEGTHQDVTDFLHSSKNETSSENESIVSMSDKLESLFVVNADTDEIREICVSQEYSSLVKRMTGVQQYSKRIIDGIKNNIIPQDRERVEKEFDAKNVCKALQETPSYYCTYTVRTVSGNELYYKAKFSRFSGNDRCFLLGIRNCDTEKRQELKIDETEQTRNNIVKILSENYTGLYFFNLKTGVGSILAVSDKIKKDTGKNLASAPNLIQAFKNFVATLVHPDDMYLFKDLTGLDSLRRMLAGKKRHSIIFRRNFDGVYEYSEMTFAKAEDANEPPVNVAVGFAQIDEDYKAKLLHEKLLRNANEELAVAKAYADLFMDTYISAYYVDIEDGTYSVYRRSDYIGDKYGKYDNYYESVRAYIDSDVHESDRELMYNATDYEHVHQRLKDTNQYSVVYLESSERGEQYIRMHVIKAGDGKHIAVCFANVDEDIRERAQFEAIENAQENSLAMERALLALQEDDQLSNLHVFLSMICECLHVDNCYISYYDAKNERQCVAPKCSVFSDGTIEETFYEMPLERFVTQRARLVQNGVEELNDKEVSDLWDAYRLPPDDPCRELVSLTGIPVYVRGALWGCLNVAYKHHHTLDSNELHFLKRAALFLNQAIERQKAYCLLEKAKEDAQLEAEFANMVIDANPSPCYLKDANDEFRYIRCNEAFVKHLQMEREQIIGRTDVDIFGSKYAEIINRHDHDALNTNKPVVYEDCGSSEYDREHTLIRWKQRLLGKDGHKLILCVVTDVTKERKQVAAERFKADISSYIVNCDSSKLLDILDFAAAKLLEFFKCEHVMLHCANGHRHDWFVDDDGTYCNLCENCPLKGARPVYFGDSNILKISNTSEFSNLKLPSDCPAKSILASQICVEGKVWGKIAVLFTKRNQEFFDLYQRVLQMAVDGIVIAIQKANAAEQLARKNTELRRALDEAKCAERVKSTFLATMSHEIRTPLNAVIGFAEFLREPECTDEARREYLDGISKSSNALLSLINDILDLSKLESNTVEMKGGKCDMHKLFNEMKAVFQFRTREKLLDMNFSISPSFPLLELHEERIRQILLNLIGNAVKFTKEGEVSCSVQWKVETGTMVLKVRDTGIGITPEKQKTIFDPFIQDSGVRGEKVYEGTGLGLAISKRLAEAAGGKLTLTSTVGKGSTFTLTIPKIVSIHEDGLRSNLNGNSLSPSDIRTSSKLKLPEDSKLILIDDVKLNLMILEKYLRNLGISENQLFSFLSSEQAYEMLSMEKSSKHLLVFTDMWMPGMNGEEFAKKVRANKRFSNIPIVGITADSDAQSSFDISLFDSILTKPVTANSFRSILCSWVENMSK